MVHCKKATSHTATQNVKYKLLGPSIGNWSLVSTSLRWLKEYKLRAKLLTTLQDISISGEKKIKINMFPETYCNKWNLHNNSTGAKMFEKVIASYVWRQSQMNGSWVLCKSELLHIQGFVWWYIFKDFLQNKISPTDPNVDFLFVGTWAEYRVNSVIEGKDGIGETAKIRF